MESNANIPASVDEYIAAFPEPVQDMLHQLRLTVQEAAPQASEGIGYGMPSYKFQGVLLYFAAYKKHVGFYPSGSGIAAFQQELSGFKGAKGSVQFPLNKPLPLDLIRKIVLYRVEENLRKTDTIKKRKSATSI